MAESSTSSSSSVSADSGDSRRSKFWKGTFATSGIMLILITYDVLQEKIMRIPYGAEKEHFKYSLFLDFCNHITTSVVSAAALLVATTSQFFISYTIHNFGALTFATIMTTRQLVSIMLSCVWFSHPLSWKQWIGAVIVFGFLCAKSFWKKPSQKTTSSIALAQNYGDSNNLKVNP